MLYFSAASYPMTGEEIALRQALLYYFNPCLKFLFNYYGAERFAQYGFNSCRQTAILGAAFCQLTLPDAKLECFEGDFKDEVHGQPVEYTHAYCRMIHDSHDILIDLSRTEKHLLYTQTTSGFVYPRNTNCLDYYHAELKEIREMNWRQMLMMEEPEWITLKKPIVLFQEVCQLVSEMKEWDYGVKLDFIRSIYSRFTKLTFESGEFFD